jgi:hypothetical protein
VYRAHWFDSNCRFHDTVSANYSKMDLSIRRHSLLEDGSPINVPSGENCAGITCDGEQKWLSLRVRDANAINIRRWSVTGEMHRGILADFKAVTDLRSSRVAFCFSFRHFWKTVAQIT